MKIEHYNKMVSDYEARGYVEVGDINNPYFIPKPSEEFVEWSTKNINAILTFKGW